MKPIIWRIRNLFVFLLALAHIVWFGARKRAVSSPKKIVVIQGAKLGDMVCTTPVFRAIKHSYPKAKLIVVGDAVNQKLLDGHPDIGQYVLWQKNFWQVAKTLKAERADFGCVMLPSLEGLALLILANIPLVAAPIVINGKSPYETATYRWLRRFVIATPNYNGKYNPREYLRLLEPIGIKTNDTKKHLTYSKTAERWVSSILQELPAPTTASPIVGVVPSVGGDKLKRWAPEKFAEVMNYLSEKYGARIVIIGTGRDRADVLAMAKQLKPNVIAINTLDHLTVDQLKALIAKLSLFISADTGPIYIAEAFGIPTIDIVGPVDENVQPPRGKLHKVVVAPRKKAMLGVLENIPADIDEALRQSEAVSVSMVTKTVDELMENIKK